jgi:hypothetical protein
VTTAKRGLTLIPLLLVAFTSPGGAYDTPVIIYYGLNESHSRSWAQVDSEGVVGVSYFQHPDNGDPEGTLVFETIFPDGTGTTENVSPGTRLEKSVLLFDSQSNPHIFVAESSNLDQTIDCYSRDESGQWHKETIVNFRNEGGRFIYEVSADKGPDGSFHLAVLKTRSNIDSSDFDQAWLDSNLYHVTNASGSWEKELIYHYDMAYTYDQYIRSSSRQDIKIDKDGNAHVVFGEQLHGADDPSRLRYATNETGQWVIETALDVSAGPRDDAGWFPSLSLDSSGTPFVACMYLHRVMTRSAVYSKLLLLNRIGPWNWHSEIIAEGDDGYYGFDGRNYTGALTHLVLDQNDVPHVVFSDIASSHWPGGINNALNVGNIRYGVRDNGVWRFRTVYRQPRPTASWYIATEMHGMCLLLSERSGVAQIVGQELVIEGRQQYSSRLLKFAWQEPVPSPRRPRKCIRGFRQ